jgi:hypothetical protein
MADISEFTEYKTKHPTTVLTNWDELKAAMC